MNKELVIYKVGTGCITDKQGRLNATAIRNISNYLIESKWTSDVLLVSSGAVAAGKERLPQCKDQQTLSSVGQSRLMQAYGKNLPDMEVAQVLLNLEDFKVNQGKTHKHKHSDKSYVPGHIVELLSDPQILPIVNENDNLSLYGLQFSDNDELATLLAAYLKPYYQKVTIVFLTSTAGVLNENKESISELSLNQYPANVKENDKTSVGRGGMYSKVKNAFRCASYGVDTYISAVTAKITTTPLTEAALNGTYVTGSTSPKNDCAQLLQEILDEADQRMNT